MDVAPNGRAPSPRRPPAPKSKPVRSLPETQEGGPGKAGGMISLPYP